VPAPDGLPFGYGREAHRRADAVAPYWGHDKIGATAYANLDKKGTQ
jgi:hypothetical protein